MDKMYCRFKVEAHATLTGDIMYMEPTCRVGWLHVYTDIACLCCIVHGANVHVVNSLCDWCSYIRV